MQQQSASTRSDGPVQGVPLEQAYSRLRRLAAKLMSNERAGHSLSPTDVVHEAMARILSAEQQQSRRPPAPQSIDLFRQAARAMNCVLIDHARRKAAGKRGGGRARRIDLDDLEHSIAAPTRDWIALNEALETMQRQDPRRHAVVLMRFFGGLDNPQIARELKIDVRTVGRDWAAAKLWLRKQLSDASRENADESPDEPTTAGGKP